ncbi:MAG: TrmB family transcriptional regulator [Halodesulfurarchaeum sp.]
MATDDPTDLLAKISEEMDLTDYEIEAYITVLRHGELTATQIAQRTNIPQPRVYDTVRGLNERGLVDMDETRPIRVFAINPETAFTDLCTRFDALLSRLSSMYTNPDRGVKGSTLVQSRSTTLRHLHEGLESAQYELVASLPISIFDTVVDELRDRYEAGVRVELILSPAEDVPSASSFDYSDVAHSVRKRGGITTPAILSADGSFTLFTTYDTVTGSSNEADHYSVVFNQSRLGFLASGFLDTVLWPTSDVVFENDASLPFPRRYATIRRAVSDINRLSESFEARVDGRNVQTGEYRQLEGEVKGAQVDPSRMTASILLDTADGEFTIGGQMATYEDFEAMEIELFHG